MLGFWRSASVVLVLVATPALADDMAMPMPPLTGGKVKPGYAEAFAASSQTMMNAMTMTSTGSPDLDFATMMLPHHQGAIDMAKVELRYGTDPAMRKLATAIVAAQEGEMKTMKTWAARHK